MGKGRERPRVAVLGAGAVGCYFGGLLARAGYTVTLIGRPAHVDALRSHGLRFEGLKVNETIPVGASTDAADVRGAGLVLFCVKSTDTETAASEIAPHLDPDAIVLNLQNGVDNNERIGSRLTQPVIPAVVYVATEMAGPGHLKHHGRGELVIGAADGRVTPAALAQVKAWFETAAVPVAISDNVIGDLWAKLIVNCAYNAISAISQMPYGEMVLGAGVRETMLVAADEAIAVARADGVRVPDGVAASVMKIAETMAGQYSSTAQDLARGNPTEIDHLNGHVARRGDVLGVPTPVNRALWALVKLLESKAHK